MDLAPAAKTKIRNIISVVYSHGIRHEWISLNPTSKVRCSPKKLRYFLCVRERLSCSLAVPGLVDPRKRVASLSLHDPVSKVLAERRSASLYKRAL